MAPKGPWKKSEQSLVCYVQALKGSMVVVELLNDVALRGRLTEADDSMNVSMTDVVSESPDGVRTELGQVWVKGMKIRYIHTPKAAEVSATVEKHRVEMKLVAMKHYNTDHAKLNLKRDTMFSSSSHDHSEEGDDGAGPSSTAA